MSISVQAKAKICQGLDRLDPERLAQLSDYIRQLTQKPVAPLTGSMSGDLNRVKDLANRHDHYLYGSGKSDPRRSAGILPRSWRLPTEMTTSRAAIAVDQELARANARILTTDAVLTEVAIPSPRQPCVRWRIRSLLPFRLRFVRVLRTWSTLMPGCGNTAGSFSWTGLIETGA